MDIEYSKQLLSKEKREFIPAIDYLVIQLVDNGIDETTPGLDEEIKKRIAHEQKRRALVTLKYIIRQHSYDTLKPVFAKHNITEKSESAILEHLGRLRLSSLRKMIAQMKEIGVV